MNRRALAGSGLALVVMLLCGAAHALDAIVEKKVFTLRSFTTVSGQTLNDVKVGYETYGRLSAAKDNAIFIPHMFLGTSHAAGKYAPDDPAPGYWDAIIGPGRPIDTDKYFVVSADALANTNARDQHVVTTGPASIDPATGRPYGTSFPMIALRDSVNLHKALLDHLGVRKLQAVAGWSMGAMQAFDWAAAYPDVVQRLIAVGGSAQADGYAIGWLGIWAKPVLLDPAFMDGNYYPGAGPVSGLTAAVETVVQTVGHYQWVDSAFGRKWAHDGKDPATHRDNPYLWEAQRHEIAVGLAPIIDANSYLLTLRAIANFTVGQASTVEEGLKRVRAPTLVIGVPTDGIVVEPTLKRDVEILQRNRVRARYLSLEGPMGHLEGQFGIGRIGDAVRQFLQQ